MEEDALDGTRDRVGQLASAEVYASQCREIRNIGTGAFGAALLVEVTATRERFVVKKIPLEHLSDGDREKALSEAALLRSLRHPNITEYFGSFTSASTLHILMEFCSGGSLQQVLSRREKNGETFDEEEVFDWFIQIAKALMHVHACKILHRDMKTSNVFLTKRNIVKLGDFGIARQMDETSDFAQTCVGTPYYLSPEVIEGKPYNTLSDVWALGVVLFQMISFRYPFEAPTLPALALRIVSGEHTPLPDDTAQDLRELVEILLDRDPTRRPAVEQVLQLSMVAPRIERFDRELRRLGSEVNLRHSSVELDAPPTTPGGGALPPGTPASCLSPARAAGFDAHSPTPPAHRSRQSSDVSVDGGGALVEPSHATSAPWGSHASGQAGSGGGGGWPLEPTPLEVPPADREVLSAYFAEAGEQMLAIAAVHKVGDKKRSERLLGVGTHRLLVLSTKRKQLLSMGQSRLRVCFWHELLSCAGSPEDGTLLRLCFVPQQQQKSVLPPLFLSRLSSTHPQVPADAMWQLMLEVRRPRTFTARLPQPPTLPSLPFPPSISRLRGHAARGRFSCPLVGRCARLRRSRLSSMRCASPLSRCGAASDQRPTIARHSSPRRSGSYSSRSISPPATRRARQRPRLRRLLRWLSRAASCSTRCATCARTTTRPCGRRWCRICGCS